MTVNDLESRFADCWVACAGSDRTQPVVVGVSGGIDSVVLLHLLCALNRQGGWSLRLHGAHLNHGLRGEVSDGDSAFVCALCERLSVPCTAEKVCVAVRRGSRSLEEAARDERFGFFERVCRTTGAPIVVVAHHADDQVETILHRIVRGTGWRGLAGMRLKRPIRQGSDIRVVRPCLLMRRSELLDYARAHQLPFREDATNSDDSFARNRIRNGLLPMLREQMNPQVDDALARLGDQAADIEAYLADQTDRLLAEAAFELNAGEAVVLCRPLADAPMLLRAATVREMIARLGGGLKAIGYEHLRSAATVFADPGCSAIDLPGNLRVRRQGDKVRILRVRVQDAVIEDAATPVAVPATTVLRAFGAKLHAEIRDVDQGVVDDWLRACRGKAASGEQWLDAGAVTGALIARRRRDGDTFQPLGMQGEKKLSDFFIDEKIDVRRRDEVIVLCDERGPIWIAPYRIAHRVRLTPGSRRALRLRIEPA